MYMYNLSITIPHTKKYQESVDSSNENQQLYNKISMN